MQLLRLVDPNFEQSGALTFSCSYADGKRSERVVVQPLGAIKEAATYRCAESELVAAAPMRSDLHESLWIIMS